MTLIVGVKCSDGIVLGADSTATYAAGLGPQTIRQDTATKLHASFNRAVIGVSGPIALSQSYGAEIDSYLASHQHRIRWRNVEEAKAALTQMFWKHAGPAWERAAVIAKTVGAGAALNDCNHSAAAAFAIEDTPHLIQFTHQCSPEEVTTDLPFVAIGSGQVSADPFLAFLRRIFWPSGLPSLTDGEIAAVWTLDQVIRTNPGGVGGSVQVVVLKQDQSRQWRCSELSADEIGTHRQLIDEMERRMREVTAPPTVEPIPAPPESPA